ncbi:uncharacterized protein C8Q71DRAFT_451352 [Rhodofomes roseus]|uniref:Uncharacterized protein n=1 Tax=Rhodofomes roseus TaxID=34475 RepID=A0ABQ8JYK2_9APHY|nr:uncharacterized protein C8Q71DRAFT_451352 [Rhodofomes roseus]KAH9829056.1 hypothetical protein C8Q71DRAFT_451352 [Rhodofomes roseus]
MAAVSSIRCIGARPLTPEDSPCHRQGSRQEVQYRPKCQARRWFRLPRALGCDGIRFRTGASVECARRRRSAASVSVSLLRTLRPSTSPRHSSIARASRSNAPAGGDDSPDGMGIGGTACNQPLSPVAPASSRTCACALVPSARLSSRFPLSVLHDPYARRSLTRILTENQQLTARCAMAFKTRHPYCAVPPPARRRSCLVS